MKRFILFLFLVLLTITVLSKVELVLSGWPGNPIEEEIIKQNVEDFNANHPDIELSWEPAGDVTQFTQRMISQISAGTGPDLFYVDVAWSEEFYKMNALYPLDLFIKKDHYDLDDFSPPLLNAFTFDERIYGIPKDCSTLALFFNKRMFDQYGVTYPENGDSYFDLLLKAVALKEAGCENPMVIAADFNRVIPFILGSGGKLVKNDLSTAITEDNAWAGIKFYVDLVRKYKVGVEPSTVGSSWIGEAYGRETVAMAMTGNWTIGYLRGQNPDVLDNTGIVQLPYFSVPSSMLYTVAWSINRYSPHKNEAWKALKFMVDEGQKRFVEKVGSMASKNSIAEMDKDAMKKPFYTALDFAHPWKVSTPSGKFTKANDELNTILKDLFYDNLDYDAARSLINERYMEWVK
jgi:multiple sugar transport system substrate-binding protein